MMYLCTSTALPSGCHMNAARSRCTVGHITSHSGKSLVHTICILSRILLLNLLIPVIVDTRMHVITHAGSRIDVRS